MNTSSKLLGRWWTACGMCFPLLPIALQPQQASSRALITLLARLVSCLWLVLMVADVLFTSEEDLYTLIAANEGKQLPLYVYSTNTDHIRLVTLVPNSRWTTEPGSGRYSTPTAPPDNLVQHRCRHWLRPTTPYTLLTHFIYHSFNTYNPLNTCNTLDTSSCNQLLTTTTTHTGSTSDPNNTITLISTAITWSQQLS